MIKQLNYQPNSEHQRRFHASEAFERLLLGGYGSGKTMCGAAEFIRLSIVNAGCDSMAISPSYQMAKKTILPTVKRLLDESNMQYEYNINDKLLVTEWGSKMWMSSADNPDALKGSNLSHVWLDEPFVMSEAAYFEVLGRIREPRAKRLALCLTGTPEQGLSNWGYREFFERKKENCEIIFGATSANPALPKQYIETLQNRYDSRLQAMYMEGKFIDLGATVVRPEWFAYYEEAPPNLVWNFVVDSAYGKKDSDNSVILCYGINPNARSLYIQNISVVNLPFPEFCRHLVEFVRENDYSPESRIIIEPKATGISLVQSLRESTNLNIIEDEPPRETKVQRMTAHTAKLEAGRVYLRHGAAFVRNFLQECAAFPSRVNDDQVDTLSMALRQLDLYTPQEWYFPQTYRGYDETDRIRSIQREYPMPAD